VSLRKTLNGISHLGAKPNLPDLVVQPDERHAAEQLLFWSGMTDTEYAVQHLVQTKKDDTLIWVLISLRVVTC